MTTPQNPPREDPPTGPIATPGQVPVAPTGDTAPTGAVTTGDAPHDVERAPEPEHREPERKPEPAPITQSTRLSSTWVAVVVAVVVLIFLLVFILQNLDSVTVHFLGASGTLPLGVAMLFGAIAGALLVALVGSARILQLRRRARRK